MCIRDRGTPPWSKVLHSGIAAGDVPPPLRDVTLRTLDIGPLQARASMKGEFENRLRQVIEEVQSSLTPIILFVDEANTLIGAGGAANLLKLALAQGPYAPSPPPPGASTRSTSKRTRTSPGASRSSRSRSRTRGTPSS